MLRGVVGSDLRSAGELLQGRVNLRVRADQQAHWEYLLRRVRALAGAPERYV